MGRWYKVEDDGEAKRLESLALENGIRLEEVDGGNYAESCPECGDYEFWHDGHCGHCGYSIQ